MSTVALLMFGLKRLSSSHQLESACIRPVSTAEPLPRQAGSPASCCRTRLAFTRLSIFAHQINNEYTTTSLSAPSSQNSLEKHQLCTCKTHTRSGYEACKCPHLWPPRTNSMKQTGMNPMKTCNSVTFYFKKNSFSDISREWILLNMILAGSGFYQI